MFEFGSACATLSAAGQHALLGTFPFCMGDYGWASKKIKPRGCFLCETSRRCKRPWLSPQKPLVFGSPRGHDSAAGGVTGEMGAHGWQAQPLRQWLGLPAPVPLLVVPSNKRLRSVAGAPLLFGLPVGLPKVCGEYASAGFARGFTHG